MRIRSCYSPTLRDRPILYTPQTLILRCRIVNACDCDTYRTRLTNFYFYEWNWGYTRKRKDGAIILMYDDEQHKIIETLQIDWKSLSSFFAELLTTNPFTNQVLRGSSIIQLPYHGLRIYSLYRLTRQRKLCQGFSFDFSSLRYSSGDLAEHSGRSIAVF